MYMFKTEWIQKCVLALVTDPDFDGGYEDRVTFAAEQWDYLVAAGYAPPDGVIPYDSYSDIGAKRSRK